MNDKSTQPTAPQPDPKAHEQVDKMDDVIRTFFIAALIALAIRAFAFEPFSIPSGSMIPNLLVGDYLFVSKYTYGYSSRSSLFGLLPISGRVLFDEPKRGDIIVFKLPRDNRTDYIKRLVGLPGDTVQVRDGLLYINGVAVDRRKMAGFEAENNLKPSPNATDYMETFPEGTQHIIREEGDDYPLDNTDVFTIPPGHYFAMGDNRDNSQDSRTPLVQFIPADNLVGKARVIFFSLEEGRHFWEFWAWPTAIRWDRLFKKIT